MADVVHFLQESARLKAARALHEARWNNISHYVWPDGGQFTGEVSPGASNRYEVIDNTAEDAADMAAAGVHGLFTNPATHWFSLSLMDTDLAEQYDVAAWLEAATRRMNNLFAYAPSLFNVASHDCYREAIAYMVLSSVADTVSMAAEAKFQGKGYLHGYRMALEDLLEGRRSDDKRLVADLAGAGLDGMKGAIGGRFSAEDGVPGMMSWAMRKMYALNLGAWWTDAHKVGASFMQMRGWAIDAPKTFEQLDEAQRRIFGLYGIGQAEWDMLRASRIREANGRGYLIPAEMRTLPTDTVAKIVGRPLTDFEAVRILDDAGDRFATMLADRADYAVPTPGGREMAMMYGGHKPGSAWGEALRYFWQFKQFPVTVLTKPIAAVAANAESRVAAAAAIAPMFLQMTAMGYAAMTLKDVFKNKEPRPVDSWETWIAAAAQGGGLGLYGDFLFGDFNRFGRSWGESFLGPTIGGLLPDIAAINAKVLRGELKASEAVRFGVNQIPFANLFYVKPVLDQILAAEVYERLNPGYRQRAEREMQRSEGRGFLFHP